MQNTATQTTENTEDLTIQGDIFDVYFSMVEDSSESPFLYHRWTLISAVAALLGRTAYIKFGFDTIYPNMYICLMGNAGTRKSSAINVARKLANSTGYNKFARERSSKEKFIKDLGEGFDNINDMSMQENDPHTILEHSDMSFEDMPASEVYITAGELEDFLGQGDQAFISLLTNLWDNLPHYSHGKMTSKDIRIKEPTVNLIGGATPVTFATVFPPEVIGQGMLSRMLLVYGAGVRKRITVPQAPDPALLEVFEDTLRRIQEHGGGEYRISPEAMKVWDAVYQTEHSLGDSRFESYTNRRHIHYYKLCIILCALERDDKLITEEIAILANTILYYTETKMPKALGEFGRSKTSDINNRAYSTLCDHYAREGRGLTWPEWFKLISTDFTDRREFVKMMTLLKDAGKVAALPTGELIPVEVNNMKELPYVNMQLLREFRDEVKNDTSK